MSSDPSSATPPAPISSSSPSNSIRRWYTTLAGLSVSCKVSTGQFPLESTSLILGTAFVEFLARLLRYTVESDPAVPFDPNSIVSLAVSTLKNHPQHAHDLRQQIIEILVAWLPSFDFKTSVLSSVLAASVSKTNEESASRLSSVLSEGLSEGLRGRNGMSASTLTALIEVSLSFLSLRLR